MAAMPWYLETWYKQLEKLLNASDFHVYVGDIVVDEDGSCEAKLSGLAEHEALSHSHLADWINVTRLTVHRVHTFSFPHT